MNLIVLFNPIAGGGRGQIVARELEAQLVTAGHAVRCQPTQLEPLEQWLDPELASAEVLIVVGGDGAMRMVAPAAVRIGVPVYHYPMGTENLFAREFSAWKSVPGLLRALDAMNVRRIDVGEANGRPFLLMASLGFDAEVVDDLAGRRSGGISHLSYVAPITRQLIRWRPPVMTVRVDGKTIVDGRAGMLVVANIGQYGMRLDPAAWADPTDGLLDVVFMPATSRAGVVRWCLACRLGRQRRRRDLVVGLGAQIEVERHGARFQLDGDSPGDTEGRGDAQDGIIEFTVTAGALVVLARAK